MLSWPLSQVILVMCIIVMHWMMVITTVKRQDDMSPDVLLAQRTKQTTNGHPIRAIGCPVIGLTFREFISVKSEYSM